MCGSDVRRGRLLRADQRRRIRLVVASIRYRTGDGSHAVAGRTGSHRDMPPRSLKARTNDTTALGRLAPVTVGHAAAGSKGGWDWPGHPTAPCQGPCPGHASRRTGLHPGGRACRHAHGALICRVFMPVRDCDRSERVRPADQSATLIAVLAHRCVPPRHGQCSSVRISLTNPGVSSRQRLLPFALAAAALACRLCLADDSAPAEDRRT